MSDYRPAKRSLGQNFLVDPNIQRKIVETLDPRSGDTVLEVGPGHGELSQHIAGSCARLILVEKDRDLAAQLETDWAGDPSVEVVEGDALRVDLSELIGDASSVRVVSNVPYNITSPLVFAFLELVPTPDRIVLMVQREVADRIVAAPGGKTYGALSVGVQSVAEATFEFRVGRGAFRPAPDVDSAVVRLEPRTDAPATEERRDLRALTRACFNRRRKQLQKTLRSAPELGFSGEPDDVLRPLGIDGSTRPESLDPDAFIALAKALREAGATLR